MINDNLLLFYVWTEATCTADKWQIVDLQTFEDS